MNILYLTYDGLTDPVGQSQILKYLIPLSQEGIKYTIVSFEKKDRFIKYGDQVRQDIRNVDIDWVPLSYTKTPPILSKIWDRIKLFNKAKLLYKKKRFDIVHCRSYAASEVGLKFKLKYGSKFLFDMRGFWADEKADAGTWNRSIWFWDKVYKFYKTKEKEFVTHADCIISLTFAAKKEIQTWNYYNHKDTHIEVIPCCVDTEEFELIDNSKKTNAKKLLNIPNSNYVISYLGSIGGWYMIHDMITFYKCFKSKKKDSILLVLTNNDISQVEKTLLNAGLTKNNFRIKNAAHHDVPKYMYASDLSMSFVKPVYSKISSSPIKNGEILSLGIPLVLTDIGDAQILEDEPGCYLLKKFDNETMNHVIETFLKQLISPKDIRQIAIDSFELEKGIELFKKVYQNIFST